ncbi:hypothetical protein ACFS32_14895 [Novosphingobium pokkalii]|uniref:hypothetical protein n=1 Tax=Novosphingobium pokkalii TaxID=1770194 RepID=UPI00363A1985
MAQSLFVRPDVQAFLDYLRQAAAAGAPAMHQMAPDQARAAYTAMQQLADLPPRDLAVIRDLASPGPAGPIPCASMTPAKPARPVRSWCSITEAASCSAGSTATTMSAPKSPRGWTCR